MQSKVVYHPTNPRQNRYFLDDKEVDEQAYRRASTNRIPEILKSGLAADGQRPSCWPLHSDAMLVATPEQQRQVQEHARSMGVRFDFDGQGRPILESQGHRRQVARFFGMTDRNASYGDPVGEATRG